MTPDNEYRADAMIGLDPFEAAALRQRRAVMRQERLPPEPRRQESWADIWDRPTPAGLLDQIKGITEGVRGAGRAVSGAYTVQPETPGQWSEADEFRSQHAQQQMRSDASALAGAIMLGSLPRAVARGAVDPKALSLASRSPWMYDPPETPRPLEADYPRGARADATGRLTHDIEGRELDRSAFVAGRRVLGGVDEGARPQEYDALATALVGRPASLHPNRIMGRDFGHTVVNPYTGQPIEIRLRGDTRPDQLPKVYAHELAEAILARAGQIPTKGIAAELRQVYNTLNNPNRAAGGTEAVSWGKPMTPQAHGHKDADIPREYMAEAIRAYLTVPSYIKSAAPNTAVRIREWVNSHPELSRIIQFNSVGAGLYAPLTFPLAGTEQHPEQAAQ